LITKKNTLMQNYVERSGAGRTPGVLNIEELATLWHFPLEANVKAPFIQKAPGRKADAPASLPIFEETTSQSLPPDIFGSLNLNSNQEKTAQAKVEEKKLANEENNDLFWVEDNNNFSQVPKKESSQNNNPPAGLPFV